MLRAISVFLVLLAAASPALTQDKMAAQDKIVSQDEVAAQSGLAEASAAQAVLIAPVLDTGASFDARHAACLRLIGRNPEAALEAAMIWTGRGGGHRARHCEAMALFANGHPAEAGYRLDAVVETLPREDAEFRRMAVNYGTEAAQAWLQAGELERCYASATRVLELDPAAVEARVTRARLYFGLDRIEDAETDLTSVLAFRPDHAQALRFRADARLRLGELAAALEDANAALALAPSVDTALVRGHIHEAMAERAATKDTP